MKGIAVAAALYTIEQATERLNTTPHFVRRLIAERRIGFTRLGRHIRIEADAVEAFIAAGRVEPMTIRWRGGRAVS
jgi:excisionase family DNA binding protein